MIPHNRKHAQFALSVCVVGDLSETFGVINECVHFAKDFSVLSKDKVVEPFSSSSFVVMFVIVESAVIRRT